MRDCEKIGPPQITELEKLLADTAWREWHTQDFATELMLRSLIYHYHMELQRAANRATRERCLQLVRDLQDAGLDECLETLKDLVEFYLHKRVPKPEPEPRRAVGVVTKLVVRPTFHVEEE